MKLEQRIGLIKGRIMQVLEEEELGDCSRLLLKRALEHTDKLQEDVRLAARLLLEQIEEEIKALKFRLKIAYPITEHQINAIEREIEVFEYCKSLIKKAFEEVIEK